MSDSPPAEARPTGSGRDLTGRTALVTGSGRSIGASIARELAEMGAHVIVNSRSTPDEARAVAQECAALSGRGADVVIGDTSTEQGVSEIVEQLDAICPDGVDVLVNNVGVSPRVPFAGLTLEVWRKVFSINVEGALLLSSYAAPHMMRKNWGRIVNISGHAYLTIAGTGVHTKASKAALVGLTRGLAFELAPYQITVNHVAPSLIDTPERRNKYYQDGDVDWSPQARGANKIPLGRLGKPEEVAGMVGYLTSTKAAYLTGQTYLVNGGVVAV